MPIIDSAELPIEPLKLEGPAVRAHASRLQENNYPRAEVSQLRAAYEPVREKTLKGLAELASVVY